MCNGLWTCSSVRLADEDSAELGARFAAVLVRFVPASLRPVGQSDEAPSAPPSRQWATYRDIEAKRFERGGLCLCRSARHLPSTMLSRLGRGAQTLVCTSRDALTPFVLAWRRMSHMPTTVTCRFAEQLRQQTQRRRPPTRKPSPAARGAACAIRGDGHRPPSATSDLAMGLMDSGADYLVEALGRQDALVLAGRGRLFCTVDSPPLGPIAYLPAVANSLLHSPTCLATFAVDCLAVAAADEGQSPFVWKLQLSILVVLTLILS